MVKSAEVKISTIEQMDNLGFLYLFIRKIHKKATKFHSSLITKEKRKIIFEQLILYNVFKKWLY